MVKETAAVETGFLRILVGDVQQAIDRASSSNTPSDRRNLLRTIVSAVEGISWQLREHVLSVMRGLEASTPLIEMAFAETGFYVTEKGKIIQQTRFISVPAMIRLVINVASSECPRVNVNFDDPGWHTLKKAIKARNRITHPKSLADLDVSISDVESAKSAFFWFLAVVTHVMEQTLAEFSLYVGLAAELIEKLRQGDPDALAQYQKVHNELEP